ncbi:hypothetical protein GCM10010219_50490 [Streptomyces netropsis]|nr:hypothetical protein GCM10010219_50490 [Streptomyces netropsis]
MAVAGAQQKCGARTKSTGRPCKNAVMKGTSRCRKHQGEWSPQGVLDRRQRELDDAKRKLAKARRK